MRYNRRTLLIGTAAGMLTLGLSRATCAQTVPAEAQRVSVRRFGARGDARSDDTAAINAAIAQCRAGETLYFPAGFYVVSVSNGDEQSLLPIPQGVDVYMEADAWIYPSTGDSIITVFMPLGGNTLQVNVDGRSLPPAAKVEDDAWRNSSHAVRAYARPDYGQGARDVVVTNSRFRNLRYAIQTEGAKNWRITNSRFERTMLSAVLLGYRDGQDTQNIVVQGNRFAELGDTAVALYEIAGNRRGQGSYLTISDNHAREYCLRTAGFAFDVEEGRADLQHHILMADNVAEHGRTNLPHYVGGFHMGYVSDGEMRSNSARGAGNTNADFGFNMLGCRNSRIVGNTAQGWRGAGINTDGSSGVEVVDNDVIDCGGTNANTPSIRIAYAFTTRQIRVDNNRVRINRGYPFTGSGAIAIGVSTTPGKSVSGIEITRNTITAPLDIGIAAYGTDDAPVRDLTVRNNRIVGGVPGLFGSWAIHLSRVSGAVVAGNVVEDARFGFAVQRAAGVTIEANSFIGAHGLNVGFELGDSSNIIVRNNRSSVPIAIPAANARADVVFSNNANIGR